MYYCGVILLAMIRGINNPASLARKMPVKAPPAFFLVYERLEILLYPMCGNIKVIQGLKSIWHQIKLRHQLNSYIA